MLRTLQKWHGDTGFVTNYCALCRGVPCGRPLLFAQLVPYRIGKPDR